MQTKLDSTFALTWLTFSQLSEFSATQWSMWLEQHKITPSQCNILSSGELKDLGIADKTRKKWESAKLTALSVLDFLVTNEHVDLITFDDIRYPESLKILSHPPCVLFVKGPSATLQQPQLSIVGSRHASPNGKRITENFAQELASMGIVITSGLARGIDSCAHKGAIVSKNGRTIAVLGCGIDICYPKYNQPLFDEILAHNGTIISEFLPNTPPRPHHFPQRNRIVAALSRGVLMVEAKIRSGSLITCNLAADLGKDVFAIPGNINQPLSEGGNWLIQQGAKLVTCTKDILDEWQCDYHQLELTTSNKKHLASDPILDSVDYDVTSLSDITSRSEMSSSTVLTALLEYELRGLIAAVPGGYLKLRGK
jgi:DNA processing protein